MFGLTHGVLWYTGVATYPLHVIADADDLDAAAVQREIDRLTYRIRGLSKEDVIETGASTVVITDQAVYRAMKLAPGRIDLGLHRTTM